MHRRVGFKSLFAFLSYFCAQVRGFYGCSCGGELFLCTGAWVLRVFSCPGADFVHRRVGFKRFY